MEKMPNGRESRRKPRHEDSEIGTDFSKNEAAGLVRMISDAESLKTIRDGILISEAEKLILRRIMDDVEIEIHERFRRRVLAEFDKLTGDPEFIAEIQKQTAERRAWLVERNSKIKRLLGRKAKLKRQAAVYA
jgi:hypothetical protein